MAIGIITSRQKDHLSHFLLFTYKVIILANNNRLPDLEKRAYLARYLMPVQLPEEFQMDNDIKIQLD